MMDKLSLPGVVILAGVAFAMQMVSGVMMDGVLTLGVGLGAYGLGLYHASKK